ncbi:MAG TPA: hypothetical protein VNV87_01305 [Acidimicrobiales bacterium]|jgi:hypothetical protein|nr:hypothetical protein [Acidimicrobiales bacterium]
MGSIVLLVLAEAGSRSARTDKGGVRSTQDDRGHRPRCPVDALHREADHVVAVPRLEGAQQWEVVIGDGTAETTGW